MKIKLREEFLLGPIGPEFLAKPVTGSASMGSFDCVAVRETNGNFAQDEIVTKTWP